MELLDVGKASLQPGAHGEPRRRGISVAAKCLALRCKHGEPIVTRIKSGANGQLARLNPPMVVDPTGRATAVFVPQAAREAAPKAQRKEWTAGAGK